MIVNGDQPPVADSCFVLFYIGTTCRHQHYHFYRTTMTVTSVRMLTMLLIITLSCPTHKFFSNVEEHFWMH